MESRRGDLPQASRLQWREQSLLRSFESQHQLEQTQARPPLGLREIPPLLLILSKVTCLTCPLELGL